MAKRVTELGDDGKPVTRTVTRAMRGASLDEHRNTQTTSLRNLGDAWRTFRAGR